MRTFIPSRVEWLDSRSVQFGLQDEMIVSVLREDATCRRCRKSLFNGAPAWPVVTAKQKQARKGCWIHSVLGLHAPKFYKVALYHERCIPPNVSKQVPGRTRLAPADAETSLRKQHVSTLAGPQTA